jgi:hypothetical protein
LRSNPWARAESLVEKLGAEGALERATQRAIDALSFGDRKSATDWLRVVRILKEDRAEAHEALPAPAEPAAVTRATRGT